MTWPGPVLATGIGSWPGDRMVEAIKVVFDECPELPYLPELPARGPQSAMIGRASAVLSELTVDLQPSGWRLTDGSGIDHRRAISLLRDDLDQLEEQAQGFAGLFKLSFAGPWTLAGTIERPRGGLILADPGARRDLGQSFAEGLAELITELTRRLPELKLIIQLDEPMLPAVHRGTLKTPSGYGRYRAIEDRELSETLSMIVDRLEPTPIAIHCCAADAPWALLTDTGIQGIGVDVDRLVAADWDAIGAAAEQQLVIGLGVAPTDRVIGPDAVAERALRPVRDLGLDPERTRLVLTPACGLAGGVADQARQIQRSVRQAAEIVGEEMAR